MTADRTHKRSTNLPARLKRHALGLALVAAATILGVPIHNVISPTNLVMLYLAAVVVAAIYLGRGPSILTSVLGVLAFDFFFVPPTFTSAIAQAEYAVTFAGLFVVGITIGTLTLRVRAEASAAARREEEAITLYTFNRDLAAARSL